MVRVVRRVATMVGAGITLWLFALFFGSITASASTDTSPVSPVVHHHLTKSNPSTGSENDNAASAQSSAQGSKESTSTGSVVTSAEHDVAGVAVPAVKTLGSTTQYTVDAGKKTTTAVTTTTRDVTGSVATATKDVPVVGETVSSADRTTGKVLDSVDRTVSDLPDVPPVTGSDPTPPADGSTGNPSGDGSSSDAPSSVPSDQSSSGASSMPSSANHLVVTAQLHHDAQEAVRHLSQKSHHLSSSLSRRASSAVALSSMHTTASSGSAVAPTKTPGSPSAPTVPMTPNGSSAPGGNGGSSAGSGANAIAETSAFPLRWQSETPGSIDSDAPQHSVIRPATSPD